MYNSKELELSCVFNRHYYPWDNNHLIYCVIIKASGALWCLQSTVLLYFDWQLIHDDVFQTPRACNGQSDKLHPFNPAVSPTLSGLNPGGVFLKVLDFAGPHIYTHTHILN